MLLTKIRPLEDVRVILDEDGYLTPYTIPSVTISYIPPSIEVTHLMLVKRIQGTYLFDGKHAHTRTAARFAEVIRDGQAEHGMYTLIPYHEDLPLKKGQFLEVTIAREHTYYRVRKIRSGIAAWLFGKYQIEKLNLAECENIDHIGTTKLGWIKPLSDRLTFAEADKVMEEYVTVKRGAVTKYISVGRTRADDYMDQITKSEGVHVVRIRSQPHTY